MLENASQSNIRAMNHMDPETKAVHVRLEAWGRAVKDRIQGALPSTTMLGRLIEQGPMGAGQPGVEHVDLSDFDAQTDAAVARLWGIGQRCIRRYYTRWEPPEVMARREGLRVRQFQEVLRRSRWLIGSWLPQPSEKV